MKRLIVNADDFGLCNGTVDGILHGWLHGIISSTSIMLTVPAAAAAVATAVQNPKLDVGVHLTFTEGWPVLAAEWVPSLLNEQGRFLSSQEWLATGRRPNLNELRAELRGQIALVRQAGIKISHLDLHTSAGYLMPEVFALTVDLAQEFQLAMRFPFGEGWEQMAMGVASAAGVSQALVMSIVESYRRLVAEKEIAHPTRFSEAFPGGDRTVEALLSVVASIGDGTTELLTHPAFAEGCRPYLGANADLRAAELMALCDPSVRREIAAAGIELVSFRQL
jgi:hypothetical protein